MKILYVEDNEDNVYVVQQRLARAGYTVLVAPDGERGLAMTAAEGPDLILMDLSLPGLDGWEVTRRLKSAPAKVTKQGDQYSIMGAAWGDPVAGVEVQVDEEPWQAATLTEGAGEAFAWTFWTLDWGSPSPGEHTITSRATGENGEVQPAPDDPLLAGKTTFWESNGQITRRVQIS